MPGFAILEHRHQGMHWDLLLEDGPAMRTWSLGSRPDTPGPVPASPLPDHRLDFLDYEGPVSRDRGHVVQWDRGTFRWLVRSDDHVELAFSGRRLAGRVRLDRADAGWTFLFVPCGA